MQYTDFTLHPDVQEKLLDLHSHFGSESNGKKKFIISDVLDSQGHQYVNLVQEGGGVLGIALVGYTYVLEQMGVRFLNLAGTSAGAINTILISAIGNKEDQKSTAILGYLGNLRLFDFVDGFWFWKLLIKMTASNKGFLKIAVRFIIATIALAIGLALASGAVYFFFPSATPKLFWALMVATLILIMMVVALWLTFYWQRRKFYRRGWGLNPGKVFRDWVTKILHENQIDNLADWQAKINQKPSDLRMRAPRTDDLSDLRPEVCLIASDITTQVKVEFPKMACLYWKDFHLVNPAEFVRASMSIPIFFEAAKVTNIPSKDPLIKQCWREMLSYEGEIPEKALMVDGGLLSNFPINIFFNPSVEVARLPTLGILLDDEDAKPKQKFTNFGSYLSAIFNTVRYYYDRDFLIKNSIFEKSIGRIDVRAFNWLNFGLTEKEKIQLFIRGAEAAAKFLKEFDWEQFKNYRKEMRGQIRGIR